jgi:hypothetical protein
MFELQLNDGQLRIFFVSVEKCRQQRSRCLAVLTYSPVRSARPSSCGLAGRAFLNTPSFSLCGSKSFHMLMKSQNA